MQIIYFFYYQSIQSALDPLNVHDASGNDIFWTKKHIKNNKNMRIIIFHRLILYDICYQWVMLEAKAV